MSKFIHDANEKQQNCHVLSHFSRFETMEHGYFQDEATMVPYGSRTHLGWCNARQCSAVVKVVADGG